MKIIHLTAALLMTAAFSSCGEKTGTQGDSTGSGVPAEEGASCTTGAGAARNRMLTGEGEKAPAEGQGTAGAESGSRLKNPGAEAPAKLTPKGEEAGAGTIPGESKDVQFEAKTKAGDDATRAALDKILDKTPTVKP